MTQPTTDPTADQATAGALAPALLQALGPRPLFVMPHPDDESHACGGLLAMLAIQGIDAHLLCVTAVAESPRHGELIAAWETLGQRATQVASGALPDGHLDTATVRARLEALIADQLLCLAPTAVVVLGPDGVYGHRDHVAVWEAVMAVVPTRDVTHSVGAIIWPVYPDGPNLFAPLRGYLTRVSPHLLAPCPGTACPHDTEVTLALSPTIAATKYRALSQHRSQLPKGEVDNFLGRGVVRVLCNSEHFAIHRVPQP